MLHSGIFFSPLRDKKNKCSNSRVLRKNISEQSKKPFLWYCGGHFENGDR